MKKKRSWSLNSFTLRKIIEVSQADPDLSHREIASMLGISHPSVSRILAMKAEINMDSDELVSMSDNELKTLFYPLSAGRKPGVEKIEPDVGSILEELNAKGRYGLTRYQLWCEYQSRVGSSAAYGYSSFCVKLKNSKGAEEISMVLHRRPGEVSMVDYAGVEVAIYDERTGQMASKAQIFVMVLGYSALIYVEAQSSQNMENFIGGHVGGFRFFGGVTKKVTPEVGGVPPRNSNVFMWASTQ